MTVDCYYCKETKEEPYPQVDIAMPFCNALEHQQWADKHYGKRFAPKDIKDIQRRLKVLGGEASTQVGENRELFKEPEDSTPPPYRGELREEDFTL